jgi:dTDP-4-amino-4,6-dideoxygalactose transaminase
MKVPLFELGTQHQQLLNEFQAAFNHVLSHGKFILGPEVEQFEKETALYCKAKHGISCASGSDALLLALMVYGIGPGDEVITSPYSFFATASCVARLGAKAVFADISLSSYNLDPEEVLKKITPKTKAIIPVHLYGQSTETMPYLKIAKEKGIAIVEDAAQAIGAHHHGQPVGAIGDIGCISFFPTKNLGGLGDGGMLLTNDDSLAEKLRVLRVHGSKPKYYHHELGINSRLDTLQAAFLRVKLPHLARYAKARQKNAAIYEKAFVESGLAEASSSSTSNIEQSDRPLILPKKTQDVHVYNQYVIRTKDSKLRDPLRKHLDSHGVGSEIYYPVPLHLQGCFSNWKYQKGDFPKSELAAESTIALPIYPELTESQLNFVVKTIESFPWKTSYTNYV